MSTAPLRILHVANYEQFKYGQWYMGIDLKLDRGLTRLGHLVLPFSQRDVARAENPFKSKKWGGGTMNRRLLETADNLRPDLILLGHSEMVADATLGELRRRHPHAPVAMWYCDPLFHEGGMALLRSRMDIVDALFTTTGGELLASLARPGKVVAHFPNPVDASAESGDASRLAAWDSDLFFAGSDYHEPERQALLRRLQSATPDLRFRIHQALGNPRIHGHDLFAAIVRSYMGLNLSRRTDVAWYSSDRLVQLAGNGCLTLCPRTPGLEKLFAEDELAWFDGPDELLAQVRRFMADRDAGRAVAARGRARVHRTSACDRVAQFMLETVFKRPYTQAYEWAGEVRRG